MNSDKLINLIETSRVQRGISQRELAKISGISRSTLNDLINGKIKKINLDDLLKISATLDISLDLILEAIGFGYAYKKLGLDRYEGMSNKQLKEKLDEYQQSEMELLDWDAKKRKAAMKVGQELFNIKGRIDTSQRGNTKYTLEEIVKDIEKTEELLDIIYKKYDYSKLPKKP